MIAIIDYGAGNLGSVKKAFDYLGYANRLVSRARDLARADRVVLPGVGAYGAAYERLAAGGFVTVLRDYLEQNRPFLGICLGMQLLLEWSEEDRIRRGLGHFKGSCRRFSQGRVPLIGWNRITVHGGSPILSGIGSGAFFYFVHSYYAAVEKPDVVLASSDYYGDYPAVLGSGAVYATQFHPEKSGRTGLTVLENWLEKC